MPRLFCTFHYTRIVKRLFSNGKYFSKRIINNYASQTPQRCIDIAATLNAPFLTRYNCVPFSIASYHERLLPVKLEYDLYESSKDEAVSSLPIVIMHGLLGSKTNWKSLCKIIAQKTGHKVYAIDARNHGDSPHSDNFNYHYMAADIENFLREVNIDKAILVGHSMGGRIAMIFALNKPESVEKLVIVDISPLSKYDAVDVNIPRYMEAMLSSLKEVPAGMPLPQARHLIDKILSSVVPNIATRQFLLTNLMETEKEIKWRCNLEVLRRNFEEGIREFSSMLGQYDGETLFICGSQSPYVPKSDEAKIKMIFRNSKFTYVEGAGHWVHAEKPTEFTKILLEFIHC